MVFVKSGIIIIHVTKLAAVYFFEEKNLSLTFWRTTHYCFHNTWWLCQIFLKSITCVLMLRNVIIQLTRLKHNHRSITKVRIGIQVNLIFSITLQSCQTIFICELVNCFCDNFLLTHIHSSDSGDEVEELVTQKCSILILFSQWIPCQQHLFSTVQIFNCGVWGPGTWGWKLKLKSHLDCQ